MNRILIITAARIELDVILKHYKIKRNKSNMVEMKKNDKEITFAYAGIGQKSFIKGLKKILNKIKKPDSILLIGSSGAISPYYKTGDICQADLIINAKTNEIIKLENDFKGIFVTSEKLANHEEKIKLLDAYKNLDREVIAVDMETFHFARFCKENKYSFKIIRAVSDDLESKLPDSHFFKNVYLNCFLHPSEIVLYGKIFWGIRKAIKSCLKELGIIVPV